MRVSSWIIAASILASAPPVRADWVVLKDGERIEGIVREDGNDVIVRLDFGTLTLDKKEVASIERAPNQLDQLERKKDSLSSNDFEGRYRLALEAEKRGFSSFARGLYREVIALAPDHKGARAALGYRQHEGQWMTEDEFMTAKGFVLHQGQWITPEALASIRRADADRKAALDEKKNRDAERAKIAQLEQDVAAAREEARTAKAEADQRSDYGFASYMPIYTNGGYRVVPAANGAPVSVAIGLPGTVVIGNPPPPAAPLPKPPPAPRPAPVHVNSRR